MKNLIAKIKGTDWNVLNRYIILMIITLAPVIIALIGLGLLLDIYNTLSEIK